MCRLFIYFVSNVAAYWPNLVIIIILWRSSLENLNAVELYPYKMCHTPTLLLGGIMINWQRLNSLQDCILHWRRYVDIFQTNAFSVLNVSHIVLHLSRIQIVLASDVSWPTIELITQSACEKSPEKVIFKTSGGFWQQFRLTKCNSITRHKMGSFCLLISLNSTSAGAPPQTLLQGKACIQRSPDPYEKERATPEHFAGNTNGIMGKFWPPCWSKLYAGQTVYVGSAKPITVTTTIITIIINRHNTTEKNCHNGARSDIIP